MRRRLLALAILLISCAPVCAADGPEILAAQYLERADTPGAAAAQLLAAEQAGEVDAASAQAAHAAIRQYQGLGPYARAKFIADARWAGWSLDRYNDFWLDQAALMLQRDETRDVERALRHLRKPWNAEAGKRRYSLWGRLYLQRRDFPNAVIALEKQAAIAGDGLFDHYSLGLALLEVGNRERGLALLDDIGLLPLDAPDHRALRDRLNLAMGWYWLASDQGGTAREYFRRVQLEGPSSNMALLGLGWAELAADGKPQVARFKRRVLCEKPEIPPDALMRLLSDRYAACRPGEKSGVFDITHDFAFDTAEHGSGRYLEALRPWQVLARRDAHDPAVQEAMLASGYAHQKRHADAEAEQAYRAAIKRYEAESSRLATIEAALRQPQADPVAVVDSQARPDEFATLRSSHRYVRAIAGRDTLRQTEGELAAISRNLERLTVSADSAQPSELRDRVQQQHDAILTAQRALNQNLRQWLLDDLTKRRDRLNQYHSRARLALAQIYDKRPVR
jgi:hypothetical protein